MQLYGSGEAPIHKLNAGYDPFAADVWSFGVTLFVLCTGCAPFSVPSPTCKLFRAFVDSVQPHTRQALVLAPAASVWAPHAALGGGASPLPTHEHGKHAAAPPYPLVHTPVRHSSSWRWPQGMSVALSHLVDGCMRVRPSGRFTMNQVRKHEWFANPRWRPPPSPQAPTSVTHIPTSHADSPACTCSGGNLHSSDPSSSAGHSAAVAPADAYGSSSPVENCNCEL